MVYHLKQILMKHCQICRATIFLLIFSFNISAKAQSFYMQASDGAYATAQKAEKEKEPAIAMKPFEDNSSQKWIITHNTKKNEYYIQSNDKRYLSYSPNLLNPRNLLSLTKVRIDSAQSWILIKISGDIKKELSCYIKPKYTLGAVNFCSRDSKLYITEYNKSGCEKWKITACKK
jgi:hypothetical protein